MTATVPTEFLARVRQATPEQQESIWLFLDAGVPLPGSAASAPETGGVPTCPSMADCARRVLLGGHTRCAERGVACLLAAKAGTGNPGGLVSEIRQGFGALQVGLAEVRKEFVVVRGARDRLAEMQGQRLFAFVARVQADDFRLLCLILATGCLSEASRASGMSRAYARVRVGRWRGMGSAYRALADVVTWRMDMGRRETVVLNEAITAGTAPAVDFEGLLSDVLDEVLEMDGETWQERAERLAELLRPYVQR